jgi:uncharacterized iron-regulated membrane protein
MTAKCRQRLQQLWRNVHLCIGAGLLLLFGAISLSGALLVWKTPLDRLAHPDRYAVTHGALAPPSLYLARVAAAGLEPVTLQLSDNGGGPVVVTARRGGAEPGARPSLVTVYLDPPAGRVLDVVDYRSSLFGTLHRFHENLMLPEYGGRSIVGWMGVAMFTSVLTGIYLWWPRSGGLRQGLRWQRGGSVLSNLHHMAGIWIAIPLAIVAITGIYLGFPQQGRATLSSLLAMAPAERGAFAAPLLQPTTRSIDRALDAALAAMPGAKPLSIALPTKQRGAWRIELCVSCTGESVPVSVDDNSGAASIAGPQLAGDRIAARMRWLHEGSHAGWLWRAVVFLCGLFPPLLGLSGVVIWLQRRKRAAAGTLRALQPQPGPAE